LLVTVILAIRKSIWTALALMSLFTLFVVDAWFDVLTALPKEQVTAVAMALLAELPLAILALGSAIWIVRQPVRRAQSHD
jgi:prepilin signal peptidase PulO-like enzyme (type II secretory pathway)